MLLRILICLRIVDLPDAPAPRSKSLTSFSKRFSSCRRQSDRRMILGLSSRLGRWDKAPRLPTTQRTVPSSPRDNRRLPTYLLDSLVDSTGPRQFLSASKLVRFGDTPAHYDVFQVRFLRGNERKDTRWRAHTRDSDTAADPRGVCELLVWGSHTRNGRVRIVRRYVGAWDGSETVLRGDVVGVVGAGRLARNEDRW